MDNLQKAVSLLPADMRVCAGAAACAEEFRLRTGSPPSYIVAGGERELTGCRKITADDLSSVLERATSASVHSAENSIKNGFITVRGGIRLGLSGSVIMNGDKPCGIRRLSGIAIRIPREVRNCCDGVYSQLTAEGFENTVIISPPGGGKTTFLRELIRRLSNDGARVSLADERGEVAGVYDGMAQFDVGRRTDVMSDAPKSAAALMLLRAMNPQILAMDEITAPEDVDAVYEAVGCGVKLLATAHAGSWEDFCARPLYRRLYADRVFKKMAVITMLDGERHYMAGDVP